jgi:hypothetical protein
MLEADNMALTDNAVIASLFEFSDAEDKFIGEFFQMYHAISAELDRQRGKPCDSETKIPKLGYGLLRGAVKALCLFWLDYRAYETCKDEADLEWKRAAIRELMERYCKKHPESAQFMGMMTMLYMEIAQCYLDNEKKGVGLDDDANLESCAFFLVLAKKGLFLREQYVDVQKLSREFIRARRGKMFSLIEGQEAKDAC